MKKFLLDLARFIISGIIALIILLLGYLVLDPYKVVKSYDSYYDSNLTSSADLNRGYVSTSTFINNYKKENYNSFIFGNSRSIFYQVSDWKKYLSSQSNCFHFDAGLETLYGLLKKIEYIDSKNIEIKNALLVLDRDIIIQDKPQPGLLSIISPELVNNSNIIDFHLTHFKAFLSLKFLYQYIDFIITRVAKPFITKGSTWDEIPRNYDISSNEIRYDYLEELINDSKYYTPVRLSVFHKRDTIEQYLPPVIKENQKIILNSIYEIFKKNKTEFKIIISPLYDQVKLNQIDLLYLNNLFGKNNVFDYSGINKYTNNYRNYYEILHYRPHVSREILNEIYKNE
jgi:hypothetical protein